MRTRSGLAGSALTVADVALAVLVCAATGRAAAAAGDVSDLKRSGSAFAAVAKKVIPGVVFIQVEKTMGGGAGPQQYFFNDPFDFFGDDFLERFFQGQRPHRQAPRQFKQMGQGSGFLISADGYILTNNHVVGDADKITVKLHDGRAFDAKRVGSDPKSEVAVIKIDSKALPFLELGDSSKLEIGEWVVAVGNPFGLAETLTAGVVSAKGRSGMGIADYEDFIQTDAAINPGNSGGPLINIDGEVVGINTAIFSRSGGYMGIGFAIPVNMARSIKDQLVKSGKVERGYLGVHLQEVTKELAESFGLSKAEGVLISDVTKDSPAEKAGMKQGDVVVQLNGKPVESVGEFRNTVASMPPGAKVRLGVVRDGKQTEISAVTASLPDDRQEGGGEPAGGNAEEKIGLSVRDLNADMARQFGYQVGEGVIVSEVEPAGLAARAGIQPGQLVTSVNKVPVSTAKEFSRALGKAEKGKTVLLRVKAGEATRYVALRIE